jgi:hypothetical protein
MLEDQEAPFLGFVSYKTLPKIGYLAMLGKHPVAAGFLRRVEGGYAQLDTFVSNRHFGSLVRHEGLSKVTEALINDAKDLKLLGILAITIDDGIIQRAKDQGFHVINQVLVGKLLD